jgi:hypothetical protein
MVWRSRIDGLGCMGEEYGWLDGRWDLGWGGLTHYALFMLVCHESRLGFSGYRTAELVSSKLTAIIPSCLL